MNMDQEFQSLISPMSEEEYKLLEGSLIKNGCMDTIKVWNYAEYPEECENCHDCEHFDYDVTNGISAYVCMGCGHWHVGSLIILDGHNRFEICQRLNIEYETEGVEVETRNEAKEWIINNQFGRRNLNLYQRSVLALKLKDIIAEKAKENLKLSKGRGQKGSQNSVDLIDTQKELAKRAQVSHDTIDKVEYIQDKITPEQKKQLQTGEESINWVYVEVIRAANKEKRKQIIDALPTIELPKDKYRTIVIDPPWDVHKIEREVAPNQTKSLDYPIMSIEEIKDLPIAELADTDCHLYLWTTQKILPTAFTILEHWGFKYIFTMVWHKPGGFQPFNLPQYNAEFVLFGRKGNLDFATTKDFPVCFDGERKQHSRKPDRFYEIINRVSHAPRLDMFAREPRNGFISWGNEVE